MLPLKDNVPTRGFPVVTIALIAVNLVVWLVQVSGTTERDILEYGYYPCSFEGKCVAPASLVPHVPWYEGVFTSMFMHASWVHVGGNMLFLWIFGNNVEDSLGHVRFLLWYVACGIAAAAAQTFVTLHYSDAGGASIPNVGASGAIAGVLGAYLILLPDASVLTLIFFFILRELPAVVFLGLWFLFQLWDGGFAIVHPEVGGGVAFFAHIGGFVFGMATVSLVAVRRPLRPTW